MFPGLKILQIVRKVLNFLCAKFRFFVGNFCLFTLLRKSDGTISAKKVDQFKKPVNRSELIFNFYSDEMILMR